MPKRNRKQRDTEHEQHAGQPSDTTFKDWLRKEAPRVLPVLLPGAIYEETLNVEIIKPIMRADKVFKIRFAEHEQDSIVDVEFESGSDPDMAARLLVYNAVLYYDYRLPVISLIIYPFQTRMAESPLVVSYGHTHILTFTFLRLALFQEQADKYVNEHSISMYPLLPTMQGTDHVLMKRAVDELATLLQQDAGAFAQQFVWLELLLERSDTISLLEKERIEKELQMYDALWENHPKVKAIKAEVRTEVEKARAELTKAKAELTKAKAEERAEGRAEGLAKGRAEGRAEGELNVARQMLVNITRARFPDLQQLAEQEAMRLADLGALALLVQQLATAPDEPIARWLLSSPAA